MTRRGLTTVATHEPGGTALAEELRAILLHRQSPIESSTELLLFAAARAQHVSEVIRPALQEGQWVLCDRFTDSTVAYQGGGLGLHEEPIRWLNGYATGGLCPDLTIVLDVSVEISASRLASGRRDRIEARDHEFHQRVREAFLQIAATEPCRVMLIDGALDMNEIHRSVVAKLQDLGQMERLDPGLQGAVEQVR